MSQADHAQRGVDGRPGCRLAAARPSCQPLHQVVHGNVGGGTDEDPGAPRNLLTNDLNY